MSIQRPRGTKDVLPGESFAWQALELNIRNLCDKFQYKEIRMPTFEHTELFKRGVGDTTDVVQKEMYTFLDRDERSITLRPEGTAQAARLLLENGLYGGPLPAKFFYQISCYRYEKPQAGRLRQFNQFGVEVFGAQNPAADAEVISLAHTLFSNLGIRNLELNINSLGCPTCRKEYTAALKAYFTEHIDSLCDTCKGRLEKNPMRIIDCKSPECKKIAAGAPSILDYICDECRDHFEKVKGYLTGMGIPFTVDPTIVRGLDYYTKTVFEFVSNDIGAQGTVCGGGRYDGLIEQLGGKPLPGLGFAMGMERLFLLLESQGIQLPDEPPCDIYLAPLGENAVGKVMELTLDLRKKGLRVETDLMGRSLKAQMKYADKLGARYVAILGDDELQKGVVTLKNMADSSQEETAIADIFSVVGGR